ncbi:MAG: RHS repeat-associated core domain-containing protein, partial [Bacteroidales bacterium]|nr:RHS repeat-associated core domain-containing protein [Bacteroidales bacterium]
TISMNFDHQGRRRLYLETAADGTTNRLDRFTYDNYVCIARNRWQPDGTSAADCFAWDPTEPVATRPLIFYHPNAPPQLYAIDGNKNISELVSSDDGTISAHYEYAPFGEVILSSGDFAVTNPFCFSSEYADDALALVYFNYRHLDTVTGRWQQRDQIEELGKLSLYGYVSNNSIKSSDVYGLFDDGYVEECVSGHWEISTTLHGSFMMWVCDVRVRKEADYKGHYQFTNNGTHCPFDYTKEDHDFGSSPFTPWGMWKHFRSAGDIIPELEEAISNCNAEKFQSLMHQLQDTRTHYDRNWRWWTLGHVFGGTSPDRDEYAQTTAWDLAEKDTKDFVEKWNSSCKLKDKCCCCIWERR